MTKPLTFLFLSLSLLGCGSSDSEPQGLPTGEDASPDTPSDGTTPDTLADHSTSQDVLQPEDAGSDSATADGQGTDSGTEDSSTQDSSTQDSSTQDSSTQDATGDAGPFGFTIRQPTTHQVTCSGGEGPYPFDDMDWICTFNYGGMQGYVYVQSTPVDCTVMMSETPIFQSQLAQISLGGGVQSLSDATYDWGGNHHNDSLTFTYNGDGYNYYHSSFGYGWRACQPMDCIQVSEGATGTPTDDGCTSDRSIPAVCSQIQADGSFADLTIDNFAKCPGDDSK